jgi:hypothetical protein
MAGIAASGEAHGAPAAGNAGRALILIHLH